MTARMSRSENYGVNLHEILILSYALIVGD